ncbi:1-phosphatidylinositol-3-phosphate 5-kinase, partial [Entomortierella chlamydospora]
ESLLNDTEFLAGANIMDYSLVVGVDDERKELVVGIVDSIGTYAGYKRIESKGKTTLRGAKDSVTVLPPQQYKTRFKEAMERYFLVYQNAVEQNQEAMREATNVTIPSTIPEVSKETLTTPGLEQMLKNKTSGYLEKVPKALLSS